MNHQRYRALAYLSKVNIFFYLISEALSQCVFHDRYLGYNLYVCQSIVNDDGCYSFFGRLTHKV